MMSRAWKAALRSPRTPRHILTTVVFREEALDVEPHPAVTPRAILASTGGARVHVEGTTGAEFAFAPTITDWPTVVREFSPAERRAPVSSVPVGLTRDARFPHDAVGPGTPPAVWGRVDLWCPGIPLKDAWPLLAGPVTAAPYDDRRSGVKLTIEDGDTLRKVDFPPGQLTIGIEDFPDAPDLVIGLARRQVIFGPFPDPIPCIPISRDGRRWYLCEPAVAIVPTGFQVGGVELAAADRPTVSTGRMASDPTRTFTQLIFPTSAVNLGLYGAVSASGGIGLAVDSAAITLLRDIGGYRLSSRAERDLMRVSKLFNFSVFQNKSGGALDLVRDRILPQTDLAMTLHLNRVETFQLRGPTTDVRLALGQGLWGYVPTEHQRSASETLYNAIEVGYRRNTIPLLANGTLTRNAFVIDGNYRGPIGALLAESEKRYGRRALTLQAADLVDDATGGTPASVVALGELTALLNAKPPNSGTYEASWSTGMGMDLYDGARLTDPAQGFNDTPVRVVRWELPASGPRHTFSEEIEL